MDLAAVAEREVFEAHVGILALGIQWCIDRAPQRCRAIIATDGRRRTVCFLLLFCGF